VGYTTDQILAELEEAPQDEAAGYDVILIPPEDETVTDEDSDAEDEANKAGNPNRLGKGILSQLAELMIIDNNDELPDLEEVNSARDTSTVVEDETAEGGHQPPLTRPVRNMACPAVKDSDGDKAAVVADEKAASGSKQPPPRPVRKRPCPDGDAAVVADETAASGSQQPLRRPVSKRARPAAQEEEEMDEDNEGSEEEEEEEPAFQKLLRYFT